MDFLDLVNIVECTVRVFDLRVGDHDSNHDDSGRFYRETELVSVFDVVVHEIAKHYRNLMNGDDLALTEDARVSVWNNDARTAAACESNACLHFNLTNGSDSGLRSGFIQVWGRSHPETSPSCRVCSWD